MDKVTLYNPDDGQSIDVETATELVRLQAIGYTDTPVFNPAEHTVEEVQEHLAGNPEDAPRVVAAEQRTKARKSIVGETLVVEQTDSADTTDLT